MSECEIESDAVHRHRVTGLEHRMAVIEAFYTGRLPLDLQALDRRILKLEDAFASLSEHVTRIEGGVGEVGETGVKLLAMLNNHIIQEQKDRVVLLSAIVASLVVAVGTLVMQFFLSAPPH